MIRSVRRMMIAAALAVLLPIPRGYAQARESVYSPSRARSSAGVASAG